MGPESGRRGAAPVRVGNTAFVAVLYFQCSQSLSRGSQRKPADLRTTNEEVSVIPRAVGKGTTDTHSLGGMG